MNASTSIRGVGEHHDVHRAPLTRGTLQMHGGDASGHPLRCIGGLPPIVDRGHGRIAAALQPVPHPYVPALHCAEPMPTASADATEGGISELEQRWRGIQARKESTTHRYTHDAEAAVDAFLKERYGFASDAIPWDYLDHPPADLELVRSNLNTLLHVTSDVFLPTSLVCASLLQPFVRSVWTQLLHPLRMDMMQFREALRAGGPSTTSVPSTSPPVDDAGARRHRWLCTEVDKDLLYMERIHRLDEGQTSVVEGHSSGQEGNSTGGREALSDFVSISGVVIGRLHRLENEHRTVLEHWSRRN